MSTLHETFSRCPHDKENPYTMISRELIRDKAISPECRWLIIYLLANKDNWKIHMREIINHCKGQIGRDRVYEIVNEAIEAGYMEREKYLVKGLERIRYLVSESPKFKKSLPLPENQDTENPDAENQDSKEIASSKKEQEKVAPSAIADAMCNFLLLKIKKQKPNFSGKIIPSWIKDANKLLKTRSTDELRKIIDWIYDDSFWSGVVLSPGNIVKNLDKIEMQMLKGSAAAKVSPIAKAEENKKIAEMVKAKHPTNSDIQLGYDYIEIRLGRMGVSDPHIKFSDHGFEEQLSNALRSARLPSDLETYKSKRSDSL